MIDIHNFFLLSLPFKSITEGRAFFIIESPHPKIVDPPRDSESVYYDTKTKVGSLKRNRKRLN